MAFTSANLDTLDAAILALATGAKSYTIDGRSVTRQDLAELRKARDWIASKVSEGQTGGAVNYASFGDPG